jgi:hypothetical protein
LEVFGGDSYSLRWLDDLDIPVADIRRVAARPPARLSITFPFAGRA